MTNPNADRFVQECYNRERSEDPQYLRKGIKAVIDGLESNGMGGKASCLAPPCQWAVDVLERLMAGELYADLLDD